MRIVPVGPKGLPRSDLGLESLHPKNSSCSFAFLVTRSHSSLTNNLSRAVSAPPSRPVTHRIRLKSCLSDLHISSGKEGFCQFINEYLILRKSFDNLSNGRRPALETH